MERWGNRKKKEKKASPEFLPLYHKVMNYAKGGRAQRKVAKTYVQAIKEAILENASIKNKENVQRTLQNLTIDNKFTPNCFWELCRKTRNSTNTMGSSVITETGNEVFGDEMIRETYRKEFINRLRRSRLLSTLY